MGALALALALAAAGPGVQTRLPPGPVKLYRIAWQRSFVGLRPLEVAPQERGGVAVDAERGLAFVGSRDGRLYAVAIPTGKARWTYDAKEDLSTRPALAGGNVLVASLQDTVFAL